MILGRKKSENSKTTCIKFRVTKHEADFLKLIANEEGSSMSDILRHGLGLVRKEMALDGRLDKVVEKL